MKQFKGYPAWLWALRYGLYATGHMSCLAIACAIVAAVVPAIDVIAIRMLATSVIESGNIIAMLVIAGLVFGAGSAVTQVVNAVSRVNALRINIFATREFNATLASVVPADYERAEMHSRIRNARQSITEGQVSSQFQASVNLLSAVVTATTLAIAIMDFSVTAAILSVLVPLPTVAAYAWYGKQESRYWPEAAQANRRAVRHSRSQRLGQNSAMHRSGSWTSPRAPSTQKPKSGSSNDSPMKHSAESWSSPPTGSVCYG